MDEKIEPIFWPSSLVRMSLTSRIFKAIQKFLECLTAA